MKSEQTLFSLSIVPTSRSAAEMNALARRPGRMNSTRPSTNGTAIATPLPPLTDDLVKSVLKGSGVRGWLRVLRVAGVLNRLSLYLFLDSYDVRAAFNRRAARRRREEARRQGRAAGFRAWARDLGWGAFDRFVRALRFMVFRGAEGSSRKDGRLEKQAAWLAKSLISLGPTFIKIGQALGTRADLLPL